MAITIPTQYTEVLFSVVVDGYGNLISLDGEGQALAQVEIGGEGNETYAMAELARLTGAVLDGLDEPLHEAY